MSDETACLNLRVGFAGALETGEETELLEERLASVYDQIHDAFSRVARTSLSMTETVLDAHAAALPRCAKAARLTLLTGYAEGADRISAAAWRASKDRRIHAVFPYADQSEPERYAWTHRSALPPPESLIYKIDLNAPAGLPQGFDSLTVLDGDASQTEVPPRSGHLEQTRFLVRWSDICVVAWAGNKARGPGGTADMVAFALAKEMPIIWIDLAEDDLPVRWIRPQGLWSNIHFGEFVDALNPSAERDRHHERSRLAPVLSPDELFHTLCRQFKPPEGADPNSDRHLTESALRLAYTADSMPKTPRLWPIAHKLSWLWRITYKSGGKTEPKTSAASPAQGARSPENADLPVKIDGLIEAHFKKAETVAGSIGDAHRGTQLAILLLAVLAVLLATLPVMLKEWKWQLVFLELLAVGTAGLLHFVLKKFASHRIWSDARRLAERLRVLRATWPLGFDIADGTARPPQIWTEWYAIAVCRAAGPPLGSLDTRRLKAALDFARDDADGIVANQAKYHHLTMERSHRWHERLERLEKPLFALFVVILIAYLTIAAVINVPDDWKQALVIVSAFYPVFAGAMLAIEAKFHFQENSIKSKAFCKEFESIAETMADSPNVSRSKELVWQAGRLLMSDVDQWRESADRRVAVAM